MRTSAVLMTPGDDSPESGLSYPLVRTQGTVLPLPEGEDSLICVELKQHQRALS